MLNKCSLKKYLSFSIYKKKGHSNWGLDITNWEVRIFKYLSLNFRNFFIKIKIFKILRKKYKHFQNLSIKTEIF